MKSISFVDYDIISGFKNKSQFKKLILTLFNEEGFEFENLLYVFTTDEELLGLNKRFLNHNTLTDILTFTLSGKNSPISSEIYISIERVKENAIKFNVSFINELCRVMIHGGLHLCGYSDHTSFLKKKMRKREDFYLSKFNSG